MMGPGAWADRSTAWCAGRDRGLGRTSKAAALPLEGRSGQLIASELRLRLGAPFSICRKKMVKT